MIGIVFLTASFILGIITARKNKQHSELLANGTRIKGVVEKVYLQKYIQYGKQSPYRIQYIYTYQDNEYHCKSCFIWKRPDLVAGDIIMVYVDELGKSTVLL